MNPVKLQMRLQPAPANLLRTAVRGNGRSVYVPVSPSNGRAPGGGDCVWTDGALSLFVKAHQGGDGLVIELRVIVDPAPPPAATQVLAA